MICPHCGHTFTTTKPKQVKALAVDTSQLSDAELFAHYRKTSHVGDVQFFARNPHLSPELTHLAAQLVYDVHNGLSRAETFKRLHQLQDQWRREDYWRQTVVPAERLKRRLAKSYRRMPAIQAGVEVYV